jgi:hypothetical protein
VLWKKRADLAIVADHLLAALKVGRRLNHRVMKTRSLVWLGYYYAAIGQLDAALRSSEESVALAWARSTFREAVSITPSIS